MSRRQLRSGFRVVAAAGLRVFAGGQYSSQSVWFTMLLNGDLAFGS